MAGIIHAKRRQDGVLSFRQWSNMASGYLDTKAVSEEELRNLLLAEAVGNSYPTTMPEGFLPAINERIQRAVQNGTSYEGDSRNLDGPWDRSE